MMVRQKLRQVMKMVLAASRDQKVLLLQQGETWKERLRDSLLLLLRMIMYDELKRSLEDDLAMKMLMNFGYFLAAKKLKMEVLCPIVQDL